MKRFIVIMLFFAAMAHSDTIVMLADEWCPYNCKPDTKKTGFVIEIAEQVFTKAGHKVQYQLMGWARAIKMVRMGRYHAIVAAAKTDAPDFIFPKNEQGTLSYVFYVKKGNSWKYKGISSLQGQTLGVIKDYTYSKEIDNYILTHHKTPEKVQVVFGDHPLMLNTNKLLANRITTFIEDSAVTDFELTKTKQKNKITAAGVLNRKPIYIAFSPKHPKSKYYAKILSNGMVELRKSGQLKIILQKYGLKDWK